MVRPLKGRKRVHTYSFCLAGEYDEFMDQIRAHAFGQKKALSDIMFESLLEYAKGHHLNAQAPELLKAIQERDQHPTAAEQHEAKVHVERLDHLASKKWPNAGVQRDKLTSRIQKALDFNERARDPELEKAIGRARSFAEKLRDLSKRGS